jgi:large subunit ribosomal protein L29
MKIKELKNLSTEELIQKEKQLKEQIFALNFQRQMGRVEKPAMFRSLRKTIAQILTILNEKEKGNGRKKSK